MTALPISQREELLLKAALHRDPVLAAASWKAWTAQIALEDAPRPELRLLTAVHGNLTRIAPELCLPPKLRGKAKANFTRTNLLARATLPALEELGRHSPVMLTKGMAICIRFGAWSSRSLFDVDFHVPADALDKAYQVLVEAGWTPAFGLTRLSLLHRSRMRRDSWNFYKDRAELDLHWRLGGTPSEDWLAKEMWATGEQVEFNGRKLLLQSPEFALLSSIHHGFVGTHADALQTVVDAAALLPLCGKERLLLLLRRADLLEAFDDLLSVFAKAGLSDIVPAEMRGPARATVSSAVSPRIRSHPQTALLDRPALYWLWRSLGRNAKLERWLIRLAGPLSKPLTGPAPRQEEFDLSDCSVVDQLAGPGWGEPDRDSFWTDGGADARLLIPLSHSGDHLLVLSMAEQFLVSQHAHIHVFANGTFLAAIDLKGRIAAFAYCVLIPSRALFGRWVEISLRPKSYPGDAKPPPGDYALTRGVPVSRLRLLDVKRMTGMFSAENKPELQIKVLRGEEPEVGKFARIKQKIDNSPHRQASGIPIDFDPVLYVLSYPDLFEHEVDPYEHFLTYGRKERRGWR
ncbi:nucleotidyltransferase family protein [Methyloceanibacter sp.]|uniref:nucleotidyltransferase family protein n=1 Tax=Methyloceanibacter sp. TaxID=1965321 RepID=UPI003D6D0ADE